MLLGLRGLNCPLPALRTRKMLSRLAYGDRLRVECTDPLAVIDIPHLLRETGDTLERREAANPPMRRDPGAVSLLRLYHGKAMPGGSPG
jgi:tRNA 2-thiouridine synthesizing protein A